MVSKLKKVLLLSSILATLNAETTTNYGAIADIYSIESNKKNTVHVTGLPYYLISKENTDIKELRAGLLVPNYEEYKTLYSDMLFETVLLPIDGTNYENDCNNGSIDENCFDNATVTVGFSQPISKAENAPTSFDAIAVPKYFPDKSSSKASLMENYCNRDWPTDTTDTAEYDSTLTRTPAEERALKQSVNCQTYENVKVKEIFLKFLGAPIRNFGSLLNRRISKYCPSEVIPELDGKYMKVKLKQEDQKYIIRTDLKNSDKEVVTQGELSYSIEELSNGSLVDQGTTQELDLEGLFTTKDGKSLFVNGNVSLQEGRLCSRTLNDEGAFTWTFKKHDEETSSILVETVNEIPVGCFCPNEREKCIYYTALEDIDDDIDTPRENVNYIYYHNQYTNNEVLEVKNNCFIDGYLPNIVEDVIIPENKFYDFIQITN